MSSRAWPDGVAPQPTWQWQFDKANELTETIDPVGRVYQQQFNPDGWLTATIAPNMSTGGAGDATTTTSFGYNLDGIRTSETTPNGGTTTQMLDDLNRVVEVDQPVPGVGQTAPVWHYTLDLDGETTQVLDPTGRTQTDTFDGMGRQTNDVSFTGVNTAWAYNNLSEVTSVTVGTGGNAETTANTWDALGRKTQVQDPLLGTTGMAYDLSGFMTSLTDSDNDTTSWTRDNLGRVTAEQNQLGYSRHYVWDSANNLTQETDRDGRVRNFSVDHLNRTTAEQWMQGSNVVNTISTAYNADGEVTSAGDNYSSYSLAYDGQGNLASVDNNGTPGVPDVVLASQFDGQGDRTSLSATVAGVKDFFNSYSYDTLSRMTEITQQSQTGGNSVGPKSLSFGYNGVGEITTIYREDYVGVGPPPNPDPADSTLSYNSLGQLTGITPEHNGTNIDPLSWTYNSLGLPGTFTTSDGTATYGYDQNNQVTSVTYTGTGQPANESYTLDANGNRTNNGFQAGTNNQLTTDGTFNFQYDQEGNRTVRTRISGSYATDYRTTYSWDYRNRLTDVDFYDNNNVLTRHVHYTYDAFNNLLSQSVDSTGSGSYNQITYFVYDLSEPSGFPGQSLDPTAVDAAVLEFVDPDGSGPQPAALAERLLVGPDLAGLLDQVYAQENVSTGAVAWLLADNLGSTRDTVDANGNVVGHYVYNSFGQLANGPTSVTQFLFTGRWTDTSTGLQYNGNRWYDPSVGRWISEDPADLTYDTNASRYVGNQPTTFIDPTGLSGESGSAPLVYPQQSAGSGSGGTAGFIVGGAASQPADPADPQLVIDGGGDGWSGIGVGDNGGSGTGGSGGTGSAGGSLTAGVLQGPRGGGSAGGPSYGRPFDPNHDLPSRINFPPHFYFGTPLYHSHNGQSVVVNGPNGPANVYGPGGNFIGTLPFHPGSAVVFFQNGRPAGMTRPIRPSVQAPPPSPPPPARPSASSSNEIEPIGGLSSERPYGNSNITAEFEPRPILGTNRPYLSPSLSFGNVLDKPPNHYEFTIMNSESVPWTPLGIAYGICHPTEYLWKLKK